MLTIEQFSTFIGEVHGRRSPFPWQAALLAGINADGVWPDVIDVPTGLGKTSILDVAVFASALGLPAARRRVFYVVDRRLVVDEAHEHAKQLRGALRQPTGTVTRMVADALRQPDDDEPLDVTRMRGGVMWERIWLDRPDRYAIVTGTVDQVGSRLLFRGYGVGERARSIDAALVGTDSLIVVDEAHLAEPFLATTRAALVIDDNAGIAPQPVIVQMSATTTGATARVHSITVADQQHPVAGARLRARKTLRLAEVATSKTKADRDMAAALAAMAVRLSTGERVVGVIVNTVARARAVFDRLGGYDALLLTGRSRQVDRDYLLHEYLPRMRVDRPRGQQTALVVVATQTLEVGANVDFDALVTESAPWGSLVQRLGRLNRMALHEDRPAPAFVVHDSTVDEDDPVYGSARLRTWTWLRGQAEPARYHDRLDLTDLSSGLPVSPAALRQLTARLTDEQATGMRAPAKYVPVLDQSILDSWTKTSPAPQPDQPVDPFLHGISSTKQPVTIVWRAELDTSTDWAIAIDTLPPAAEEGLDVSVTAVRRWLTGNEPDRAESDIESIMDSLDETLDISQHPTRVLRYTSRGNADAVFPRQIRPGDTIIVSTTLGGCDRYGWHPTSTTPVVDVADLAPRRGRPYVRLGPTLISALTAYQPEIVAVADELVSRATKDAHDETDPSVAAYRDILHRAADLAGTPLRRVLNALMDGAMTVTVNAHRNGVAPVPWPAGNIAVLALRDTRHAEDNTAAGSTLSEQRMTLDAHQRAVASQAMRLATNLRLAPHLIRAVTLAGRWHDEGKRDPRFQTMLWNDPLLAEIADELLAKSGMDGNNLAALRRAQRQSGYPTGMRHEALSARIAPLRLGDADPETALITHLIASHHGCARPLLPPIVDREPVTVDLGPLGALDTERTVDWRQPATFERLHAQYGRWGLALLESIVRLADIWCSVRNRASADEPAMTGAPS